MEIIVHQHKNNFPWQYLSNFAMCFINCSESELTMPNLRMFVERSKAVCGSLHMQLVNEWECAAGKDN